MRYPARNCPACHNVEQSLPGVGFIMSSTVAALSFLVVGILFVPVPGNSGAPRPAMPGTYTPPIINGWNKHHVCQAATGICVPDQGPDCEQGTDDSNNNNRIDPGELVNCRDNVGSAW